MPATRHVALLIEATNAYARGLLHGVAQYTHDRGSWTIYFEPHAPDEPPPKWLKNWKGDGILARIGNRRAARAVLELGMPVVELRRILTLSGIPSIGPDNQAVARIAADHLRERGFRHFGFCGFARGHDPPLDHRAECFERYLEAAGLSCSVFEAERNAGLRKEQARMVRWLRSLPKPARVMTCNDTRGLQVLRACVGAGIPVPDHIAVIGAGNDDCICSLSNPSLTSVDLGPEAIGYEAAGLLDRLMSGRKAPAPELHVPPRGIVTRLSTDVLATDDLAVSQAVGFIRHHACEDILVSDVLGHVRLSRSALEPRLKRVLGRTIHQEIQHVRLERVKTLLSTTDVPTKQIGAQTGFHSVQYLARVFRKSTGHTTAGYRKKMRR
ncbi:MAG TPA: DNA-binding transcriptional regulator [Candidatus Binatia bacterium]|jgi:LacI family transcriptional regulator|nr:DNA-binding transcriptional regulator [Candidatus Binatia bacterium]